MTVPAFTLDDGALGLEAIWTWATNAFVLNDQAARPEWVALQRITGLFDGPDLDAPADKRFGRVGESARPASPGGKTVVLEGEVRSQTLAGLRARSAALRGAFAPSNTLVAMTIAPHAAINGPSGVFYARPLSLTMDETQAAGNYRRPFQLNLRLSDPRVYFPSEAVDETGTTDVTVTNEGTAPAEPIVSVEFSADTTITIVRDPDTDGAQVATVPLVYDSGTRTTAIFDFARRTILDENDYPIGLDVSSARWWDAFKDGIAPGATVEIAQYGGDTIRVQFAPAMW